MIPVITQALTYSNTQLSILIPTVFSQSTTCLSNVNFSGPVTFSSNVNGLAAATVGLGNVNNTAASALPISALTQSALNNKLTASNPTLTGTLTNFKSIDLDNRYSVKELADNTGLYTFT